MFRDIDGCLNSGVQETLTILNGLTGINLSKASITMDLLYGAFIVSPTKFSLTDYRVTVISSGIENAKLLKIQALAAEFVKQAIDPDVLVGIMNKKSVHEVENILKVALAARRNGQHTENATGPDQAQEEISSYKLR
jgi:hypothetical protein